MRSLPTTWFRRATVTQRLIAAIVAAGLLPLVVIGLIGLQTANATLGDNQQAKLQASAANVADLLDRNLFERYGDVQAFALSGPAMSMEGAEVTRWIDTMMGIYTPIYNLMVVADMNGRIIAVNGVDVSGSDIAARTRRLIGRDVSDAAWFTTATAPNFTAGTTIVEDVHDDRLTKAVWGADSPQAHSMSFTSPIRNSAGQTIGVWSNRINLGILDPVIGQVRNGFVEQGDDVHLTIVNASGSVLASTSDTLTPFSTTATGRIASGALETSGSGSGRGNDLDGRGSIIAGYAKSPGFETYQGVGWRVVATQTHVAGATALRNTMMIVGAILVALIAAAAWFLARRLAAPPHDPPRPDATHRPER